MDKINPELEEASNPCRILIAEDNPINLKLTAYYLDTLYIAYDSVSNGLEVLEALEHRSYDLILMDCLMPDLDGYEATGRIRVHANNKIRNIPIIGVTSQAVDNDSKRCFEAGMSDYLTKPLRLVALQSTLKKWLPDQNPKSETLRGDEV